MEPKHRSLITYTQHYPDPKDADAACALVAEYQSHGFDAYVSERGQVEVRAPHWTHPIRAFVVDPDGRSGKLMQACDRSNSISKINDHRGNSIISTPFKHDEALWVRTGNAMSGGESCERVVPEAEYSGQIPVHNYDEAPWLTVRYVGYAGLRVLWRKQPYVFTGEHLYLYGEPATIPEHPAPDPSGDRSISLPAKGMVELFGASVLEDKATLEKIRAEVQSLSFEMQRDYLRANRCPLIFKAGKRLWLYNRSPGEWAYPHGVWDTVQLHELTAPNKAPRHITPNRWPVGRGFGSDTGRIVIYLDKELAITDHVLHVGTYQAYTEEELAAQANQRRKADLASTPISKPGARSGPNNRNKAGRDTPEGPLEQLGFTLL